jgi:hypothetical protein
VAGLLTRGSAAGRQAGGGAAKWRTRSITKYGRLRGSGGGGGGGRGPVSHSSSGSVSPAPLTASANPSSVFILSGRYRLPTSATHRQLHTPAIGAYLLLTAMTATGGRQRPGRARSRIAGLTIGSNQGGLHVCTSAQSSSSQCYLESTDTTKTAQSSTATWSTDTTKTAQSSTATWSTDTTKTARQTTWHGGRIDHTARERHRPSSGRRQGGHDVPWRSTGNLRRVRAP